MNPIRGVKVMERHREIFPEEVKKLFAATNLREHGATTARVLQLTDDGRSRERAVRMGHSPDARKKYHRRAVTGEYFDNPCTLQDSFQFDTSSITFRNVFSESDPLDISEFEQQR